MSDGNKNNNGVHEVGTEETRLAYQNDTPGQHVERYLNTINEVINEKKEKQKKSFTKVFDNPLKGFPYNEELDDNFVTPLEEEVEDLEEISDKEIGAVKKLSKDMQAVLKGYQKITGMGDKELKNTTHNPTYKSILDARDKVLTLIGTLATKQQLEDDELAQGIAEGAMSELLIDIQQGATAKELARDHKISLQNAKDFLKDYYSQKKKPLKMGEETEILRNYDSLLEAKDLMPDIKKIVDTKSATKVGGVMLDMFTASMILTVYDKVNDQNKDRMEKSNIQTLVHIAHKVMGVKEETISELRGDAEAQKADEEAPAPLPTDVVDVYVAEGKKIQDIVRKHKRELQKVQKSGNLELSKKAEDELTSWASSNGEIRGDDEDEFIEWLDNNLDDLIKGKIKEGVKEEKVKCPECKGKEGGCDHCDNKGYHIEEAYRDGGANSARWAVNKAKNKKDMSGAKLTGQEISVYFKRNKVRDKMTKKAVEIALDHGGAYSYAIKQIEKLKKGLSKDKDVEKALNYANFGESVRVNEVGFMFKEDTPIAGNMQVEGDPYLPQKKGVNKNIANYWNKEIKGLKPKELEAIQSMYMITDHSGVVQMYKAGKRDFIKSIKESNGKLTRTTNEAKGSGNMYLEIQFNNRNEASRAMDVIGGEWYMSRASEIENEKETVQFFDVNSKDILKMLKQERKLPKFKVVTDEKM